MYKCQILDENTVVKRYADDRVSMNTVAREFRTGRRQIKRILLKHGVTIRPPYVKKASDQELLDLFHNNDLSYSQIAAKVGLSLNGIKARAHRLGIRRGPGEKCSTIITEDMDKQMIELRREKNLTALQIAVKMGVPRHRVELRLEQLGFGQRNKPLKGRKNVATPPGRVRNRSGTVLEHILIAEKKMGRLLTGSEIVHHIDLNHQNNHPDNLYVYDSSGTHMRAHAHLRRIAIGYVFNLGLIEFRDGQYSFKEELLAQPLSHANLSSAEDSLVAK